MIYGSVCSGIESASAAWEPLGWKAAFFSEIDDAPRAVLKHHYPHVPLHGDFTTIKENDYAPIDLLVGGTPCQDFSVAGLRKGIAGDRGNLTIQYVHLLERLRPAFFVWENVPGVLSSDDGLAFGLFLGKAAGYDEGTIIQPPQEGWQNSGIVKSAIRGGYGLAWRVLDAQFYGVAQRRRRVFVVGYFGDWRPSAAVLFDTESMFGNPAPRRKKGERVAGTLAQSSKKSGGIGMSNQELFSQNGGNLVWEQTAHTLRGEGFDASEDGSGRGTPLTGFRMTGFGKYSDDDSGGTVKSRDHKDATDLVVFDCKGTSVHTSESDLTPTLRSMSHDESHMNGGGQMAVAYPINTQMGLRGAETSNSSREGIGIGNAGDPAFTLQANHGHAVAVAIPIHDKATRHSGGGDTRNDDGCSNGLGIGQNGDPMATLDTSSRHAVAFESRIARNGRGQPEAITPPLKARSGETGKGDSAPLVATQDWGRNSEPEIAVRRLTPRECERLQGFEDDYTLVPFGKRMMSDSQRYKMIGNSKAVPVVRKIGRRIEIIRELMGKK